MKKVIITLFLLLILLGLSGCNNKRLDNPYFVNDEENTHSEAVTLLNRYLEQIHDYLDEYYPRSGGIMGDLIYSEDTYVNAQLPSKDTIYRHEFYNYTLSEDRDFMRYSKLYYLDDSSFGSGISSSSTECKDTLEGEKCVVEYNTLSSILVKASLQYFVEGDNLYYDFLYIQSLNVYHYTFLFYRDDSYNQVMEMSRSVSDLAQYEYDSMTFVKMIFGVSEETFICSGCKNSDPSEGELEYIYTKYKEHPYDSYEYETSNIEEFTRMHIFDGYVSGTFFNGLTGEKYEASMHDDTFETSSYASFIRNTKVVEYSNTYYFVNLQEILGWDRLVKVSNENNAYLLYYGDTLLSSDYHASIVYDSSEYPYIYLRQIEFTDEILSLSVFGLTTPYTNDYFINKFNEGGIYADSILVNHHLNKTYAENYALFNEMINRLK